MVAGLDGRSGSEQPDLLWEAVSQREMSRDLVLPLGSPSFSRFENAFALFGM